ncbi:hypothetical protein HYV72_01990 [Candidatus Uhrbacteria bacterium]|nr:hypothetical protein [Candidatus Uhrbacteria bacterium]
MRIALRHVDMRLPSLLLPNIRLEGSTRREAIAAFLMENETLRAAKSARERARIMFGRIASRFLTHEYVDGGSYLLALLFQEIVCELQTNLRAFWTRCIHPDYHDIGMPILSVTTTAAELRFFGFDVRSAVVLEDPKTMGENGLIEQRNAYEARLLYFLAERVLACLLEDDPYYRDEIVRRTLSVPSGGSVNTVDDWGLRALSAEMCTQWVVEELKNIGIFESQVGTTWERTVSLDPENEFRLEAQRPTHRHTVAIQGMRFVVPTDQGLVPVMLSVRVKNLLRLWSKWTMRAQSSTDFVPDILGVRLVAESFEEMMAVSRRVRSLVDIGHGTTIQQRLGETSPTQTKLHFYATVHHTRVRGIHTELQVTDLATYVNVKYSLGDEQDGRYRLRRFWQLLPVLRPKELWGVEWNNNLVFRKNFEHVMEPVARRLLPAV